MMKCCLVPLQLLLSAVVVFWAAPVDSLSTASRSKNIRATGPLVDYVYRDDPLYEWTVYSRTQNDGFTTVYLNMTSQRWYDETLTNHPIWYHFVVVNIPDSIQYPEAGFLHISSGNNPGPPGNTTSIFRMGQYAVETGIVTATIVYIPNQPFIFENDGIERREDELIAWTWRRFYNESSVGIDNPEILLRMPMCKASVRAMDAVQEFITEENGNAITSFMVSGESKRGWTTWLVGAIDNRVVAMAPVVLSCLNMIPNFHHYWRSLGGWSFALYDYWMQGIMGLIDEPEMLDMAKIVDPYEYRQWMTMPKLLISGASDEFFMMDDYDYFYSDLLGEKHIWIIENSGHSINRSPSVEDYYKMLQTFFIGVLQDYSIPEISWTRSVNSTAGSIFVYVPVMPISISAYSAPSVTPDRRDFRLNILDESMNTVPSNIVWTESPVTDLGSGSYTVEFSNPPDGYLAFFIKVRLPGPDGREYILSTEANIIPATFPYADCSGSQCQGMLL
jgi:PhoPQ-activated pathogenicity-related protein